MASKKKKAKGRKEQLKKMKKKGGQKKNKGKKVKRGEAIRRKKAYTNKVKSKRHSASYIHNEFLYTPMFHEGMTNDEREEAAKNIVGWSDNVMKEFIAKALSFVPIPDLEKVIGKIIILIPAYQWQGEVIPKVFTQNKTIILISDKYMSELIEDFRRKKNCGNVAFHEERAIYHLILHEVAHCFLEHEFPTVREVTDKEYDGQEKEANNKADEWLMNFKSV